MLFLLTMIVIIAVLDIIGVASILPFMTVLKNPEVIETKIILEKMFKVAVIFRVENEMQFLFVLGILAFLLLIISLIFKALTTYTQLLFTEMTEYSIGVRPVEGYLN